MRPAKKVRSNGPELPGAARLMKIPAATGDAAMQPVGATHDRQSPAFATATIQLQTAYAATCHIHAKNQLQRPVRPAAEMQRRRAYTPAFIALKKRWPGVHCTKRLYAALTCLPYKNTFLVLAQKETTNAIFTGLGFGSENRAHKRDRNSRGVG